MSTKKIGDAGEDLACSFLKKQGFKILERNFRIRGGEIDIVAKQGQELIFIEVKSRFSHKYGQPAESITPWKLNALKKTAMFYIVQNSWGDKPYRIDLVGIDYTDSKSNPAIELIQNITS